MKASPDKTDGTKAQRSALTNAPPAAERIKGRRAALVIALAVGLSIVTILLLAQERVTGLLFLLTAVFSIALGWGLAWRPRRPLAVVAMGLAVVLLYTWSLGPEDSVVVRATPAGFTAVVDGNSFFQPDRIPHGVGAGRLGLYAGGYLDYTEGANGGTVAAGASPLTWLANALRFAVPRPAWAHLRLQTKGTVTSVSAADITPARGTWTTNPRGEIEGSLGAVGWIQAGLSRTFTLSGDLVRADGRQGILLGVGPTGHGYLLAIRLDHRDARFYYWNNGIVGVSTGSHPGVFPVATVPMIQRALQFALPSIILSLALILLALFCNWLLAVLVRGLPATKRRLKVPSMLGGLKSKYYFDIAAVIAAALGTMSAALIALNINQTLPTIEDTSTYIFQAKMFALGRLWAPIPASSATLTKFFPLPFVIAFHDHWFGKYPPGWPLLLSIGAVFDKAWMVPPIVGGLSLLLIYLIGKELYGTIVGLVGTVLALSSPFMLSMSGSLLSQSATWLWCGAFAYLVIVWTRRSALLDHFSLDLPRKGWFYLVGAGAALGMAFATRQLDALALGLPFLVCLARKPLAVAWVMVGSAAPLMLFALYNVALTGTVFGSGYRQAFRWDRFGFGPAVGGPTRYERGFTFARGIWNFAYDLEHLQSALFGWPFFVGLSLVALPFLLLRARAWDWLLLGSALTVVAAYMGYWASGVTGGLPRYWFVIVPWIAILAARGLQELYCLPSEAGWIDQVAQWTGLVFPAALVALMMAFDVFYFLPANVLYYRNPEGAVVAAVDHARIHHAIVFQVQHNTQNSEFDVVFSQNSPLMNGNILWAKDKGSRDVGLMRKYPNRAFYRLNGINLTRIYPPSAIHE